MVAAVRFPFFPYAKACVFPRHPPSALPEVVGSVLAPKDRVYGPVTLTEGSSVPYLHKLQIRAYF